MNQRERKRAAIINAAISEFIENGFKGSSMDAISARAEVSKRTVYNHFENKELLFQAIVMELFRLSSEQVDYRYDPDSPLEAQLSQIARNKINLFSDSHMLSLVKVIFAECMHSPHLIEEALTQYQQQEQGLDNWISAAIADGKLKQVEPSYAAEQFMGLLKSTTFWPQILMNQAAPSSDFAEKVVSDSVAMFLNYYRK